MLTTLRIWWVRWRINDTRLAIENAREVVNAGPKFIRNMEENVARLECELLTLVR